MKVHKMSTKQFAKFVIGMQNMALKNRLRVSYAFTDKYDYECKQGFFLCDIDWKIGRRLGGATEFSSWAVHDSIHKVWTVREGEKLYKYLDSDIEKAVQNG
mgnify:CR=1 FL=1